MKRYEGLFILDTAGKEEGIKDVLDKVSEEITTAGGKVETVQKMDKRPFARTNGKLAAGFYVNVIFEIQPSAIVALNGTFALNTDVYRVVFTLAPAAKVEAN